MARANPLNRLSLRAEYVASQAPRVARYLAQGAAMRRIGHRHDDGSRRHVSVASATPSPRALYEGLLKLFAADMANVEAGLYPPPAREDGGLPRIVSTARDFFDDVPRLARRRNASDGQEVWREGAGERLPRYYRQNFHFQTDGWLSDRSARLYDTQVETLFAGAANAMRRQALVPVHAYLREHGQSGGLVDIACGTGRFLRETKRAFPRLAVCGVDLSEPYLKATQETLRDYRDTRTVLAKAEALPFEDASRSLLTSVYLFHELPPKTRREVAREISRVLAPGGRFVLTDSLQRGDTPGFDGLLERFPIDFHEPYFTSYMDEDFGAIFAEAGLTRISETTAWLSKVTVFEKA